MQQLGLSESELEHIICVRSDMIMGRLGLGSTLDKTQSLIEVSKALAKATRSGLREVATAIAKNNERIAEQLEEAGFKIT